MFFNASLRAKNKNFEKKYNNKEYKKQNNIKCYVQCIQQNIQHVINDSIYNLSFKQSKTKHKLLPTFNNMQKPTLYTRAYDCLVEAYMVRKNT